MDNRTLKENEFEVYYQPKVCLRDNSITKVEALLRWPQSVEHTVSPAEFIPVAEQMGLITELGDWVIKQVCKQQNIWKHQGLDDVVVAEGVESKPVAEYLTERYCDYIQGYYYYKPMNHLDITSELLQVKKQRQS